MMSFYPWAINEVGRVIPELKEHQDFTLIFFNGEGVIEVPGAELQMGLRAAIPAFKDEVVAWIAPEAGNIVVGGPGSRHAIEAITLGLSYEPDIMFIMSDDLTGSGRYELYQEDIMAAIAEANTSEQPTRIHTIQIVAHDPLVAMGMAGTLERIAEETGGVYKFLDGQALNLR